MAVDRTDGEEGAEGKVSCEKCGTRRLRYAGGDWTEIRDRRDRHGIVKKLCRMCGAVEELEAFVTRKRLEKASTVAGNVRDAPEAPNAKEKASSKRVKGVKGGQTHSTLWWKRLGEMFGEPDTIRLHALGVKVETIMVVGEDDGGDDGNAL